MVIEVDGWHHMRAHRRRREVDGDDPRVLEPRGSRGVHRCRGRLERDRRQLRQGEQPVDPLVAGRDPTRPGTGKAVRFWIDANHGGKLELLGAQHLLHQVAADVARADDRAGDGSRIVSGHSAFNLARLDERGRARAGPRGPAMARRPERSARRLEQHSRVADLLPHQLVVERGVGPRGVRISLGVSGLDLEVAGRGDRSDLPGLHSRFMPPNDSNAIAQTSSGILTAARIAASIGRLRSPTGLRLPAPSRSRIRIEAGLAWPV